MAARSFNVSVILGVVDKATAGLSKFNQSIQKNKETIHATGVAAVAFGGAVVGALGFSVKAAAEQETVMRKLQHAVTLTGNSWGTAKPELDKFIASMQAMTIYGDTETATVLKRLMVFTNDVGEAMEGTKLAADMAASGMFNMDTAARYVGMAMSGNVEILGRYIPELRAGTNEMLKNMSATQKTDYAMKLLREKFGGMAEVEMQTLTGLTIRLRNYLGDLSEAVGDQLLPTLKAFTERATDIIKRILAWTENNKALTGVIVKIVAVVGTLSLAFGGILLALPTIVSGFTSVAMVSKLLTVKLTALAATSGAVALAMKAIPFVAVASAVAVLGNAIMGLAEAHIESRIEAIKTGNTHREMIEILEKERTAVRETLKTKKLSAEEHERLLWRLGAIVRAIRSHEAREEKEANEKILADRRAKAAASAKILTETNAKALEEQNKYQEALFKLEFQMGQRTLNDKRLRIEQALANVEAGTLRELELRRELFDVTRAIEDESHAKSQEAALASQYTISGGFSRMIEEMTMAQIHWGDTFVSLAGAVQTSISTGFAHMLTNIGAGWQALSDGMTIIGEGIKTAVIKQISDIAASYVMQYGIIAARWVWLQGVKIAGIAAIWVAEKAYWAARKIALAAVFLWEQAVAAVSIVRGWATIPFVGWAIGIGAAVAAVAALNARFKFFAEGVENFAGGMAIVGERGPELVRLPAGADVYSNIKTRAMLAGAGGGGLTFNLFISGNQILNNRNAQELADKIGDVILSRVKNERNI